MEYATKDGIQRHYVAAHHMRYDRRTGKIILLSGGELAEEMKKLKKKQYSGKNRAAFVPTDEPYRKCKCRRPAQTTTVSESSRDEDTDSVESITFHSAGQASTSRSIELDPATHVHTLPDSLSMRSEDVDVDLLNRTLISDSVSTASASVPQSRTSMPLPSRAVQPVPLPQATVPVVHDVCQVSPARPQSAPPASGLPLSSSVRAYNPHRVQVWSGIMLSIYPQETVQDFTKLLVERRPPWISDEHLQRAVATFRDYEAGHRRVLALVHDILRAADLSPPSSILSAMAEVACLTQQAMARPYTDPLTEHTTASVPVPVPDSAADSSGPRSSPAEGVLVIDLPGSENNSDSDPSQYSDSTVNYAAEFDDISD